MECSFVYLDIVGQLNKLVQNSNEVNGQSKVFLEEKPTIITCKQR